MSVEIAGEIIQKFVAINGRKLYLDCRGRGPATILIEVGKGCAGTTDKGWFPIRDALLSRACVCLYDRAGTGRSDPAPMPFTIDDFVQDLSKLIHMTSLRPPLVLVGMSFGGLIVQHYVNRYPDKVAGVILVESSHPDQQARFEAVLPLLNPRESPSLQTFRQSVKQEAFGQNREPGSMGQIPLTVVTAGKTEWEADFPEEVALALDQQWLKMQKELTSLSEKATHLVAQESYHSVQNDQPKLILQAIEEMMERVSGSSR